MKVYYLYHNTDLGGSVYHYVFVQAESQGLAQRIGNEVLGYAGQHAPLNAYTVTNQVALDSFKAYPNIRGYMLVSMDIASADDEPVVHFVPYVTREEKIELLLAATTTTPPTA